MRTLLILALPFAFGCISAGGDRRALRDVYEAAFERVTQEPWLSEREVFVDIRVLSSRLNGVLSAGGEPEDFLDVPEVEDAIRAGAEAAGLQHCRPDPVDSCVGPRGDRPEALVIASEIRWVTAHLAELPVRVQLIESRPGSADFMLVLERRAGLWSTSEMRLLAETN